MKKFFGLLCAFVLITSCDVNTDPIEFTATTSVVESLSVSIPQTTNATANFNETVNFDLNSVVSNFSDINGITINSFTYKYQNVTGNTNAVIQSATIIINGVVIANLSDVNMAQEAANGTVFSISDSSILEQIETIFLNNTSVNIGFSGTAVSDAGPVNFDIELTIDLTVSL